jgi:hypothetical protein
MEATVLIECAKGEGMFISEIPLIPSAYPFVFKVSC